MRFNIYYIKYKFSIEENSDESVPKCKVGVILSYEIFCCLYSSLLLIF